MIRIVGGDARGRLLKVPPNGTRPTSERAREALFSSLQSLMSVDGARILDLYAGSGAVGLEALSRGATHATFVEDDRSAAQLIRENADSLALSYAEVRTCTAAAFVASVVGGARPPVQDQLRYDLVFLDPPYAVPNDELAHLLGSLVTHDAVSPDGVLVVERAARTDPFVWPEGVVALKHKRYGEGVLWYGQQQ